MDVGNVVAPLGAVGLSVDSPICRSVVRVHFPDSVQPVVSLGRTLSSYCPVSRQIVRLQQIVCNCMILEVSTEYK